MLSVVTQGRRQVGRHVGGQGVTHRVGPGDQHNGDEELAPVGAQHVPDPQRALLGQHDVGLGGGQVGGLLVIALGLRIAEGGRVLDTGSQIEGDAAHGQGDEEGQSPPPGLHDISGERQHEGRDEARAQGVAHIRAPVEHGRVEAAPLVGGVLGNEGRGARVLTTGGEALNELEADKQDGRPDAEYGSGRQCTDSEGRQRHHHEGEGEDLLAAEAVAELPQNHPAQRPGDEGDGEDTQGEQGLGRFRGLGQECLADQNGNVGVHADVVPLHDVADDGAHDGSAERRLLHDGDVVCAQPAAASHVCESSLLSADLLHLALCARQPHVMLVMLG